MRRTALVLILLLRAAATAADDELADGKSLEAFVDSLVSDPSPRC